MRAFQFDLLKSQDENLKQVKAFDTGQILPINPLQEKLQTETPELSSGEMQIMEMVLSGKSIKQIALTIFLSIPGVKWRLSNIYKGFGVENRLALIEKASKEGLQFYSEDKIKHTFHNKVNLRAHEQKP